MRKILRTLFLLAVLCGISSLVFGQITDAQMAELKARAAAEGWTFQVDKNPATEVPLSQLCGFKLPSNWKSRGKFTDIKPKAKLPDSYDWRTLGGVTPIRNQASCGSCWAFGTIVPIECNILIKDKLSVDLSEQWLLNCNQEGYDCSGGFWVHDYFISKTDTCNGSGGVLESDLPYVGTQNSCGCPYNHYYWIKSWSYISGESDIPAVNSIKQAILDYGPVSVAVYVDSAFQAYTGGVFNSCSTGEINHAVGLVGWDDANQCWIMKNSWGTGWGEQGYMRIAYNCSMIGYSAVYVEYAASDPLQISPADSFRSSGEQGGPFGPSCKTYTLLNTSSADMTYIISKTAAWLDISPITGAFGAAMTSTLDACINSNANSLPSGTYTDTISIVNLVSGVEQKRNVYLYVSPPPPANAIYWFSLNSSPGWTTQGQWEFGAPLGQGGNSYGKPDPISGATGLNVYGVNLAGDYSLTIGGPYYLTAGPFDLSQYENLKLEFMRWLNIDYQSYAYATVDVSNNGSDWTPVWNNGSTVVSDADWTKVSYDISSVADNKSTVYIRWGYQIGYDAYAYSGWNIDDIGIFGDDSDAMTVTPDTPWDISGYQNESFNPSYMIYTVSNTGSSPLEFGLFGSNYAMPQNFTTTLPAGNTFNITFTLDPQVNYLTPGVYTSTLNFVNMTTHYTDTREMNIEVKTHQGEIAVTDTIAPQDDLQIPFGSATMGTTKSAQVVINNTSPLYNLIVTDITLNTGYFEDFNDGLAQDWVPDLATNFNVVANEYVAQNSSVTEFLTSRYMGASWNDLSVKALCHRSGVSSKSAGIFLRGSDDFDYNSAGIGSGYVFQISLDGSYSIWKQVAGSWSWVVSWASSSAIVSGTNELAASAEGSNLKFYINGTLVWSGTDTSLTSGRAGVLGATASDGQTIHYFDNFEVGMPISKGEISAEQALLNKSPIGGTIFEPDQRAAKKINMAKSSSGSVGRLSNVKSASAFTLSNVPALPATILPNSSIAVNVGFSPQDVVQYSGKLTIKSNDEDEPKTELPISGEGIADTLAVTPSGNFLSSGIIGGPFTPQCYTYTLSNSSGADIDWTASKLANASWLDISPESGKLSNGASIDVSVCINSSANAFTAATYTETIQFTNTISGMTQKREVSLTVSPLAPEGAIYWFPLNDSPNWTTQGEWAFGIPLGQGGSSYGSPDPTSGATGTNVYGVNLAGDYSSVIGGPYYLTAGPFNLSGYQDINLQFKRWLNTDYQPYAYATVDVSTDGSNWSNVWGNGSSSVSESAWSSQTYDLSQWADRQSNVYLRWGYQIGSNAYIYSGWNIDDIGIFGIKADPLVVSPKSNFYSVGQPGGQFTPSCMTYTVQNMGENYLAVLASHSQPWLSVSPITNTLPQNATSTIEACINSNANSLPEGLYTDTITITNVSTQYSVTRKVMLNVITPGQWTFLVYIDGDNNLEEAAVDDFMEMSAVGSDNNVKIAVMIDRISGYDSRYDNWTGTKRGLIIRDDTPSAGWGEDLGELNMGAQQTLTDFISWGMQTYPASKYALILWNHGGGWYKHLGLPAKAVCWDDTNGGDCLYMKEVRQALEENSSVGKTSLFGFDACLMGMLEVSYELRQCADVIAFSEESIPFEGWPYTLILTELAANPNWNAAQLGTSIVNNYYTYYTDNTISAVDLSKMDALASSVSSLGDALVNFYSTSPAAVLPYANTVMNDINSAVIAEKHGASDYSNSHGIAIYHPSDTSPDSFYSGENVLFPGATKWDEYLSAYYSSMTSTWVATARNATQSYDYPENIDLYNFCENLIKYVGDTFVVSPSEDFNSTGYVGGPFTPSSMTYTLSNTGSESIGYLIQSSQPWFDLGPVTGALGSFATQTVSVSLNSQASLLAPGTYTDTLTFNNLTSGYKTYRNVNLTVLAIPGEIAVTDTILPAEDLSMPFGTVNLSQSKTEHITIANTDSTHNLVINNIYIGGSYFEDFNDGLAQGWSPDSESNWSIVSNEYAAQNAATTEFLVSKYIGQAWGNLSVKANFRRTGYAGYSAGIILRASDDFDSTGETGIGSAYIFQISEGGSYGIWKQIDGSWSWIVSWTGSSAIISGGTNELIASAEGSNLKFYINGTLVWSGTDTSLTFGRAGLGGYTATSNSIIHYFDNFQVGAPITAKDKISEEQIELNKHPLGGVIGEAPAGAAVKTVKVKSSSLASAADFTLGNLPTFPVSIAPNSSITFDVTYSPQTGATHNANVYIESNDADESLVNVSLSGTGFQNSIVYNFDTDSEGWLFSGKIGTLDTALTSSQDGRIGLSANGSAHCFAFWLSPAVRLDTSKTYKASFHMITDSADPDMVPQIRLRALQPSNWMSWYSLIISNSSAAPGNQTNIVYDIYLTPVVNVASKAPLEDVNFAFDILSIDAIENCNTWIYCDKVEIQETTVTPLSNVIAQYGFDTDSSGWASATSVIGFDTALSVVENGKIGLNANGSANCFAFWLSPDITILKDKIYKVKFTIESNQTQKIQLPQVRLRVTEPYDWRGWGSIVYDTSVIYQGSSYQHEYEVTFKPQLPIDSTTINLAFDIISIDPSLLLTANLFLDNVIMEEVSINP